MHSFGYLREEEFSKIFKNISKKKLVMLLNCVSARDPCKLTDSIGITMKVTLIVF